MVRPALPPSYRVYAVWRVPATPNVSGVVVCAEPGGWDRFLRYVLQGPYAGSGARLRRADTVELAEELYRAEAPRHRVPLEPGYWTV